MSKLIKGIRGLLVLAALLVAGHAQALMLSPSDLDQMTDQTHTGKPALHAEDVADLFGTTSSLSLFYKAEYRGADSGLYKDSYMTMFGGDPNSADIYHWEGAKINCVECYLVVKNGAQPQYLFDLSARNWDGKNLSLRHFYENTQGAISHIAIFGAVAQVPEAGALVLMGLGLLGLGLARRRETKVSA